MFHKIFASVFVLNIALVFGMGSVPQAVAQSFQKSFQESFLEGDTPGALVIIQGATNETHTTINVRVPRMKSYTYKIKREDGTVIKTLNAEHYQTIEHSERLPHWKIHKLVLWGLEAGATYTLDVIDYDRLVDQRVFKTLDTTKDEYRFVLGSCMTDDLRYRNVRKTIWNHIRDADPEFLILTGDLVYVDGFETVPRLESATPREIEQYEFHIWQRFIDSTESISFFHEKRLVPLFGIWDDHDAGTNNANKTFVALETSKRVFDAFFGSAEIEGFYEKGIGVSSRVSFEKQRFFLLDGRYRREPHSTQNDHFGQLGQDQYRWFLKGISKAKTPAWIFSGDQFFADTVIETDEDGRKRRLNESFYGDHLENFKTFLKDLGNLEFPVVFGSGDIHASEVLQIDSRYLGYQTYEFTSSPIHSYIFGGKGAEGWDSLLEGNQRLNYIRDHNFMVIESKAKDGALEIKYKSIGAKGESFFKGKVFVQR